MLTIEKLKNFIENDSINTITIIDKNSKNHLLFKIKYDENIVILYAGFHFLETKNILSQEIRPYGFYNKKEKIFYNLDMLFKWYFDIDIDDKTISKNKNDVITQIKLLIKAKICEIIEENEDILNLTINDDINKCYSTGIKSTKDYFFEGKNQIKLVDTEFFKLDIDDDMFIEYITTDKEKHTEYITKYANKYIQKNRILLYQCCKDIKRINQELDEINNDKDNILHKKKAIKEAVQNKKTVNVTIVKNGIKFTFKTDTETLQRRQYNNYYSTYAMPAKDRKKYEELFGDHDYIADEIQKIKYKNKVIYQKEKIDEKA